MEAIHRQEKKSMAQKKLVMEQIKYVDHNWVIYVDLKMINFLLGQQSGYTEFLLFLSYRSVDLWTNIKSNKTGP